MEFFFYGLFLLLIIAYLFMFVEKHTFFKYLIVVLSIIISISLVFKLEDAKGYPTSNIPNHSVRVEYIQIVDPNELTKGGIYVYALDGNDYEPKSYVIPYDSELAKRFKQAKYDMAAGYRVNMKIHNLDFEFNPYLRKIKKYLGSFGEAAPELEIIDPRESLPKE